MKSESIRLQQAFIFGQAFMRLCALRGVPVGDRETRQTAKIWKELRAIMRGKKAMSPDEQSRIGIMVDDWQRLEGGGGDDSFIPTFVIKT